MLYLNSKPIMLFIKPHGTLKKPIAALAAFFAVVPIGTFVSTHAGQTDSITAFIAYHPQPGLGVLRSTAHTRDISIHIFRFLR
jgi:hypothetical protein